MTNPITITQKNSIDEIRIAWSDSRCLPGWRNIYSAMGEFQRGIEPVAHNRGN